MRRGKNRKDERIWREIYKKVRDRGRRRKKSIGEEKREKSTVQEKSRVEEQSRGEGKRQKIMEAEKEEYRGGEEREKYSTIDREE